MGAVETGSISFSSMELCGGFKKGDDDVASLLYGGHLVSLEGEECEVL